MFIVDWDKEPGTVFQAIGSYFNQNANNALQAIIKMK